MSAFNLKVSEKVFGIHFETKWACRSEMFGNKSGFKTEADAGAHAQKWPHLKYTVTPYATGIPRKYDSDPAADYAVLQHVRDMWTREELLEFTSTLDTTFKWNRTHLFGSVDFGGVLYTYYTVGDYARAALAVVEEKE